MGGTMAHTGSVCPGAQKRGAEEAPPWRRAARSRFVSSLWSISTLDACEAVTALLTVPALRVGHEVRRLRTQTEEGPKARYTNPQVL